MTTMYIRHDGLNWQWNDTLRSGYSWHTFPMKVKSQNDMQAFFRSGGHRGVSGGNFDIPQLTLVDNENNPLRHYSVKIDKSSGLHSIIIDFDDNKKKILTTAQLWSESEQLNFLRQSAVSLPEEYTTVKSALSFLANADPFAVEEYHDTLKQKLTDGITAECQQHAGKVTPVVGFIDN